MTTNPAISLFASSSPTSPSTISPCTTPAPSPSSFFTPPPPPTSRGAVLLAALPSSPPVGTDAGTLTSASTALSSLDSCAGRVGSTLMSWVSEMVREAPMGRAEEGAIYSAKEEQGREQSERYKDQRGQKGLGRERPKKKGDGNGPSPTRKMARSLNLITVECGERSMGFMAVFPGRALRSAGEGGSP